MPPLLLDARARAADASSSSFVVMVSLASLAEVHYAVFPVPTTETPTGDDGLSADHGEARGHGPDGGEDGGVRDSSDWGCGNHTANVGERREATALNDTVGLVVSGVIPSTTTAGLLHLAVAEKDSESVPGAAPSTLPGAGGKSSNTPASVRSLEGNALEVMFRVEGLQAAQAYSVCLFTETPGSNGCVTTKTWPNFEAGGMRAPFFVCIYRIYYFDALNTSGATFLLLGCGFCPIDVNGRRKLARLSVAQDAAPFSRLRQRGPRRRWLPRKMFEFGPQPFVTPARLGATTTFCVPLQVACQVACRSPSGCTRCACFLSPIPLTYNISLL